MAEVSLGHAVAVAALAPVAERLADERAREEAEAERRHRLEDELEALPSLERPTPPEPWSPWWVSSRLRQEILRGLLLNRIPMLVVYTGLAILAFMLIFGSEIAGIVLGVLCGVALVFAWVKREILDVLQHGRGMAKAREGYSRAVKAYDAREAERAAIEAKFGEGAA